VVRALALCVYIDHGLPCRMWSAFSEPASMKTSPNHPNAASFAMKTEPQTKDQRRGVAGRERCA
jgi:hypothetical protein